MRFRWPKELDDQDEFFVLERVGSTLPGMIVRGRIPSKDDELLLEHPDGTSRFRVIRIERQYHYVGTGGLCMDQLYQESRSNQMAHIKVYVEPKEMEP